MRIMAINTAITLPRSFGEIPVACHATMRAFAIVSVLRAVALGAQLHDVLIFNGLTIGQAQCVVVIGVMA